MEDQPQSKRMRRPSVRLGEIGLLGPCDASELWLEAPRQLTSSGKKAPRIRSLENVGGNAVVLAEEWSVDEPAVASADEEKVVADGEGPASTPVKESHHVKRRSGLNPRKTAVSIAWGKGQGPGECRLARNGSKMRWKHEDTIRPTPTFNSDSHDQRADEEKKEESLPLQPSDETPCLEGTSSDSEELIGTGSKGEEKLPTDDSENGASDRSEEGDAGTNLNSPCYSDGTVAKRQRCIIIIPANPHCNGDEMQGAIEDGPGQATGKGSSTVKQREGVRRLGRQAARRSNPSRDAVSRDLSGDSVSRDTATEPSGRFQASPLLANGAIVVTPSFSARVTSLSAGVNGWLQGLGLGKYSEAFELNEVDNEVLPLLTMNDLREMGVDAVGARRKLYTHIQELGQFRPV